jgi:hypothetical protein
MSSTTEPNTHTPPAPKNRWWLWSLATIGVFFLLTIVLTPFGIRWGIENWLRNHGATNAEVKDVDFNPFTGRLTVKTLEAGGSESEKLASREASLVIDWFPFWKKRILLPDVKLNNAVVNIHRLKDGTWIVGRLKFPPSSKAPPPTENEAQAWGFGLGNIDLKNVALDINGFGVKKRVTVVSARIEALESWRPNQPSRFDLRLAIDEGTVHLNGEMTPFAESPSVQGEVAIQRLPLAWLGPLLQEQKVEEFAGNLETKTQIEATLAPGEEGLSLNLTGPITLLGLRGNSPDLKLRQLDLAWEGKTEVAMPTTGPQVKTEGSLSLKNLDLLLTSQGIQVKKKKFSWQGTTAWNGKTNLRLKGESSLTGLTLDDIQKKRQMLHLKGMQITDLQIDGLDNVSLAKLNLAQTSIFERQVKTKNAKSDPSSIIQWDNLKIEKIAIRKRTEASMEKVLLNQLQADLVRDPKGELELLSWLPATTESEIKPAVKREISPPFTIRVGQVKIGDDSRLAFTDQSVNPHFQLALQPLTVEVRDLDSLKPEKKIPFKLAAKPGKYSSINAEGTIQPFAKRPTLDLQVQIEKFRMPPLSSYTNRLLGYQIKSGQYNSDLDLKITQGNLQTSNKLVLNKLKMEPLKPEEDDEFTKKLGLPLNTALSLLRDKNDDIHLTLGFTGDVRDPKFDFSDAYVTVVSKAITTGILAYFGPLGALSAANKLVNLATALRFDSVMFPAGGTDIDAGGLEYLGQIANRLGDRPKVRLSLCGKATANDYLALLPGVEQQGGKTDPSQPSPPMVPSDLGPEVQEQLRALAGKRGEVVKEYLVEKGIEPNRLFLCHPEIDRTAGLPPQVEVSL